MPSRSNTIVIVEDEEVLLDVLKKKLDHEGFTVFPATDGKAGFETIQKHIPDLVLLDILLPQMNGYQVLESMKKDPKLKKIPVIVISNSGQPVEIKRILDGGARDYLIKADFTPDEVMQKVRECLGSGPETKQSSQKSTEGAASLSDNKKVLLVEDDKFLGEICSIKLKKEGFDVDLAIDGESGLQKAQKEKYSIVLLDIRLPGMDGFQVLEKLKAHSDPNVSKIPVVMISNFGQEEYVNKALSLGAIDYIVKANFTTDEIAKKISSIIADN